MSRNVWIVEVEQTGRQRFYVQASSRKEAETAARELIEPGEWLWDEVDAWADPDPRVPVDVPEPYYVVESGQWVDPEGRPR